MIDYIVMTATQINRLLLAMAILAAMLFCCVPARGDDERALQFMHDDGTYGMVADLGSSFDPNVIRRAWNDSWILLKPFAAAAVALIESVKAAYNVTLAAPARNFANGDASDKWESVVYFLAEGLIVAGATGNLDSDSHDDDPKGFKTPHNAAAKKDGDSRTGIVVDRHGCSVETSSSTENITISGTFGSSGSSSCTVVIGGSE